MNRTWCESWTQQLSEIWSLYINLVTRESSERIQNIYRFTEIQQVDKTTTHVLIFLFLYNLWTIFSRHFTNIWLIRYIFIKYLNFGNFGTLFSMNLEHRCIIMPVAYRRYIFCLVCQIFLLIWFIWRISALSESSSTTSASVVYGPPNQTEIGRRYM